MQLKNLVVAYFVCLKKIIVPKKYSHYNTRSLFNNIQNPRKTATNTLVSFDPLYRTYVLETLLVARQVVGSLRNRNANLSADLPKYFDHFNF